MRTSIIMLSALLLPGLAGPALAQDTAPPEPITVSGGATVTSDYRFRGVSQTDEDFAVQGTINVSHESGFYVGTWGSTVSDYVAGPGADAEIDLYGGYRANIGLATLDAGLLYYVYTGAGDADTDFIEPYASISAILGPVTGKLGVAYAPSQDAIGGADNLYTYGDLLAAVPTTPITLKAHLGYSAGDSALTLGGENYLDWSVGADYAFKGLTFGVAYVDTDLSRADADAFFGDHRHELVDATVLFSVGASF